MIAYRVKSTDSAKGVTREIIVLPKNRAKERPVEPFSIFWVTIPGLSWICPIVGHVGISNSRGEAFEIAAFPIFGGPCVSENAFPFGKPVRVLKLDPQRVRRLAALAADKSSSDGASSSSTATSAGDDKRALESVIDRSIDEAVAVARTRRHKLFYHNCHTMVLDALTCMDYEPPFGIKEWSTPLFMLWILVTAEYASDRAWVRNWLPFFVLLAGLVFAVLRFLL